MARAKAYGLFVNDWYTHGPYYEWTENEGKQTRLIFCTYQTLLLSPIYILTTFTYFPMLTQQKPRSFDPITTAAAAAALCTRNSGSSTQQTTLL